MRSVLPIAGLLVLGGCYDSLTEADLCNPNFEDCSQYESNSGGTTTSNSGGSEIGVGSDDNGMAPCGWTHCSVGQECETSEHCYSGICMTVTGPGAPNYAFCTESCWDSSGCLSSTSCMDMQNGEKYCVPMQEEGGEQATEDARSSEPVEPHSGPSSAPSSCVTWSELSTECLVGTCADHYLECLHTPDCEASMFCALDAVSTYCPECCLDDWDCYLCGAGSCPHGPHDSDQIMELMYCISQKCS